MGAGRICLEALTQWTFLHQLRCLAGGFAWPAATVCYARRSGEACLYCGRRDDPEGWTSPGRAAHWGAALAVAALGYDYRGRGPSRVCGRGAPG